MKFSVFLCAALLAAISQTVLFGSEPVAEKPAASQAPLNRTPASAPADDPAANIFADAAAFAQPRCVKLYGAGIGREHGYATGILVSDDGKILCAQGIYLSGDNIRAVLADGSVHLAQVQNRSESLQAALLKIDARTPKFFELPDVCPAKKGDWVLAVSNLFKVAEGTEELSVSLGVASLRTRLDAKRGASDIHYDGDLLLIDAITSNPGAPGGALVTVDGRLAGMIGRNIESTYTDTRLNYAIPSDLLRKFLDGKPIVAPPAASTAVVTADGPATLGIQLFTLGGKKAPAYIDKITPDSPAHKAGLKKDDMVIALGTEILHNVGDYQKAVADLKVGVEVSLLVKRGKEVLHVNLVPVTEAPAATSEKPALKPIRKIDPLVKPSDSPADPEPKP